MNGKSWNAALRISVVLAGLVLLSACAARPEPQVESLLDVPSGKAVVVGRIELHPPLRSDEQDFGTDRGEELKNAFILYCGDRPRDLTGMRHDDFSGSFATTLDKNFFIKIDAGILLYVSGGTFYSASNLSDRIEPHTFSSQFQVELRPDDEAVYIGTIQYIRDESNNLASIMIRDDYKGADSEFKERFGTVKGLRKALLAPAAVCCK